MPPADTFTLIFTDNIQVWYKDTFLKNPFYAALRIFNGSVHIHITKIYLWQLDSFFKLRLILIMRNTQIYIYKDINNFTVEVV